MRERVCVYARGTPNTPQKSAQINKRDLSAFCVPSGTSYREACKSRSNRIKVAFSGFLLPFGGKRNAASKGQTTKKALQWDLLRLQAQKRVICDLRAKNKAAPTTTHQCGKSRSNRKKTPFLEVFCHCEASTRTEYNDKRP